DQKVILKILHAALALDPPTVRRFRQEIRALARLRHPNIVEARDAALIDGEWLIVFDYVPGITLKELATQFARAKRRAAEGFVVEILRQVAAGLQHALDLGVIHRDIKPGNLLVLTSWRDGKLRVKYVKKKPIIKILDFGMAKLPADDATPLTWPNQFLG